MIKLDFLAALSNEAILPPIYKKKYLKILFMFATNPILILVHVVLKQGRLYFIKIIGFVDDSILSQSNIKIFLVNDGR